MWKTSALSVALVLSCEPLASAEHLGTYGETFGISEEDLLAQIKRRLTHMRESGELTRLEHEFADRAKAKIRRPVPVMGITHTAEPRAWAYDPSWTAPEDIRDTEGRLVIAPGQPVNPLVFYDQEGLIKTKFGIRAVPAKVSQSGRQLQVEEVLP